MTDLLKLIFCFYLITLFLSLVVSIVKFWIDTSKFARKKKTFEEDISEEDSAVESEVIENAVNGVEYNSQSIFGTRDKS